MWFKKTKDPLEMYDIELVYEPKEDLTAYEFSTILVNVCFPISGLQLKGKVIAARTDFDKLDEGVKRHFIVTERQK